MRHKNGSSLMFIIAILGAFGICIAIPTRTRADAITDWNVIGLQEAVTAGRPGGSPAIDLATMHAAMYDAVQAIEQDYEPLSRYRCSERHWIAHWCRRKPHVTFSYTAFQRVPMQ